MIIVQDVLMDILVLKHVIQVVCVPCVLMIHNVLTFLIPSVAPLMGLVFNA